MRSAITRRGVVSTVSSAVAGAALGAVSTSPAWSMPVSPSADAALLDLGRRWEDTVGLYDAAADAEIVCSEMLREVKNDQRFQLECDLFDEIVKTPAHTIEGLALKGRLLARASDCEERDEAAIARALEAASTFLDSAAFSLALDVVRLSAIQAKHA